MHVTRHNSEGSGRYIDNAFCQTMFRCHKDIVCIASEHSKFRILLSSPSPWLSGYHLTSQPVCLLPLLPLLCAQLCHLHFGQISAVSAPPAPRMQLVNDTAHGGTTG